MQKYGQHFLINQNVITQIVDAAQLLRAENLIEIGPGQGALTQALILRGYKNFTAVEIDTQMVDFLKKHLPEEANIKIICQNFLDFDFSVFPSVPTEFIKHFIIGYFLEFFCSLNLSRVSCINAFNVSKYLTFIRMKRRCNSNCRCI